MRKTVFVLLTLFSLFVAMGSTCFMPDPPADSPNAPDLPPIDPGTSICCGVTHTAEISGVSPTGGQYYVMAVLRQDSIVAVGRPVFIPEGDYSGVELSVTISYLSDLEPGDAVLEVLSFADQEDILSVRQRGIAYTAGIVSLANYADSVCEVCCTDVDSTIVVRVSKNVGTAVRASASIDTKYGMLCGQGTATEDSVDAQSNAWVGVQRDIDQTVGHTVFLQMGYMHRRLRPVIDTFVYVEWLGTVGEDPSRDYFFFPVRGQMFADIDLPMQGSQHRYEVIIDSDQGNISFNYDQTNVLNQAAPYWSGKSVPYVLWEGEIRGLETDMPGTSDSRCRFLDCEYRLQGESFSRSANFGESGDSILVTPLAPGLADQWGVWVDTGGNTLHIWDITPLGDQR